MFSLHIDTQKGWRGGQRQVLLAVQGLRALGHRAFLVAHPAGELLARMSEGHDLVGLAPSHEADLATAWRLSRIMRDLRPQLVHAHDAHGVSMAALALSFGRMAPQPRLVASRRVSFHLKQNSLSRWKYRQVDRFLTASHAIGRILVEDGIEESRLVTVYEGIDVEQVLHTPPLNIHAELWLPTHAPVIGQVAALTAEKGHRYLIEAARIVVRHVPDARFVILGEGELRSQLEHQIREHRLEKHVILAGFRPDVLAFHRSFDLFVLSSLKEGLGTSILDAMAASKAVVATDTGGIPEAVIHGRTGLLVPPRDAQALADSLIQLLEDEPTRTAMGRRGFERIQEHFSVQRMLQGTLEVYEGLAT